MNKTKFNVSSVIAVVMAVSVMSCGGSKPADTTASAPAYNSVQSAPTTEVQTAAANRGVKLQKEECEEMALMPGNNPRESGSAISNNEAFSVNLALIDARSKMAQQLEVMVKGLIGNFNQQHAAAGATSSVAKASLEQQGYFNQFLTNTRPICKNTYVREDGQYNTYVTIEIGEDVKKSIHNQLSKDGEIAIDFAEHQFLQEMDKAREDYRQQKMNQ